MDDAGTDHFDDVVFEKHYRATRDLKIELRMPRREHNDGGHLVPATANVGGYSVNVGSDGHRGDDFNQAAGHVLEVPEGHVVRLSETEAAEYLDAGDLVPAP